MIKDWYQEQTTLGCKRLRRVRPSHSFGLTQKSESMKGKTKMAKINEVAPITSVFEGIDKIQKEDIVGQEIKVLGFAKMTSENGDFSIGLIEVNGKTMTTTFSNMITERLESALEKVGRDDSKGNDKEIYFKDAIEGKLTLKESQKNANRKFYMLE